MTLVVLEVECVRARVAWKEKPRPKKERVRTARTSGSAVWVCEDVMKRAEMKQLSVVS